MEKRHSKPTDSTAPEGSRRAVLGAGLASTLLAGMLPDSTGATRESTMTDAAARWEILQCIYRCARGMDRNDFDLAMSAFHPDALDDHGVFVGLARDFLQGISKRGESYVARQHFIMNHLAEIDGNEAHAETYYFAAFHRKQDDGLELYFGRYLDRFEYRDGRWAIAARVVVQESALDPVVAKSFAQIFIQGTQDRSDPSYQRPLRVTRPLRNNAVHGGDPNVP